MLIPQKYKIIYADPPWAYRDTANAGKRGASHKYGCLTLPQLCALQIDERGGVYDIADDRSACFMWYTPPMKEDALFLMRAWGFKPVQDAFTWVKTTKHGKYHFGMGTFTRANAEHVLLGFRGQRLKRHSAAVSSLIVSPVSEHSAKPPETRDRIVQVCGDLPRIELFARERCAGWDAWGNELPCVST